MKKMAILSLMLVALLALFVPVTRAQDGDCYNLSEADCAVLSLATATMSEVTSFTQRFTLTVKIQNLGSVDAFADRNLPENFTLQVTGEGNVVINPETEAISISLPMVAVVNGETGNVAFYVADEIVYFGQQGQLIGIPIAEFEKLLNMGDMVDIDIDMPEMPDLSNIPGMPDLSNIPGMPDLNNMPGMPDLNNIPGMPDLDALSGLGNMLGGFVGSMDGITSLQRLPDVAMMNMTLSPFVFRFDVAPLLEELGPMIGFVLPMLSGLGEDLGDLANVLPLLPQVFQSLQLNFDATQFVGADNFIHAVTFNMNLGLDVATLNAIANAMNPSDEPLSTAMGSFAMTVNFNVELSQFNQPLSVVAPSGARILTAEEVQALFGDLNNLADMLMP